MKKALFAVFSLSLFCAPAFTADGPAVISEFSGDVSIVRDGAKLPVTAGTRCQGGDRVQTGAGSRLDVAWGGLWGCRLLGATDMEIKSTKLEDMSIAVTQGDVLLKLAKLPPKSNFRLETPVAVAAVRGTQFWGRVNGDVTSFAVRSGSVEITVKGQGVPFLIHEDQALDVAPGVTPVVRAATGDEKSLMRQAGSISIGEEGHWD